MMILAFPILAQEKAVIFGTVNDAGGKAIEYANVAVMG